MEKGYEIKVLDHGYVKLINFMGSDEEVIEAARMSTNKGFQTWEKDLPLLDYLYRNDHTSPSEMAELVIEVQAPIFVFREWHRHRSQCLSGDTEIYFEKPARYKKKRRAAYKIKLKDLYKKWYSNNLFGKDLNAIDINRNIIKKMKLRNLNEETNEFEITNVVDVIKSSPKHMFKIILKNNKFIICSADHKFIFNDGWKSFFEAANLQIINGKAVYDNKKLQIKTNGTPCYQDKDWLCDKYHIQNLTLYEISKKYNVNYNTLRKWIKIFNLQKRNSFPKGHIPWNLGKTYKANMIVSDEHKIAIKKARSGANSNFWKGGISGSRRNIGRWTTEQAFKVHTKYNFTCQNCGKTSPKLVAHHIVPVWMDESVAYDFDNLITICTPCHKIINFKEHEYIEKLTGRKINKLEYEKKKKEIYSKPKLVGKFVDVKSIEYVGEEECYDLSVLGPYHNFVANGIVTHNSFNEMSARYTQMPDLHYLPDPNRIKKQSKKNNQGSSEDGFDKYYVDGVVSFFDEQQKKVYSSYNQFIQDGVAKEIARINTPVSRYSKMRAKSNLRNWFHFLDLRMRENAQWEIRQFANAVAEIIKELFPKSYAEFEEHTLFAVKLSKTEIDNLREIISEYGLSKNDFIETLKEKGMKDETRIRECVDKIYKVVK